MEKTYIKINFDCACDNNSKLKLMGLGVAVFVNQIYSEELSRAIFYGTNGTNNIGEWAGFEHALDVALELKHNPQFKDKFLVFSFYGDSMLVIKQFHNEWKIKNEVFRDYYDSCKQKYLALGYDARVEWTPRTDNKEADHLSKVALTQFTD